MKKLFCVLILSIFLTGCSSESVAPSTNQEEEEEEIIDPVIPDAEISITDFSVAINSPEQIRDFSYYDNGYNGIFENPDASKSFKGKVNINYEEGSSEIALNDINIVWRSSIDGVLFQGNPDENYNTELERTLSKGVHKIFLEASILEDSLVKMDSLYLSNEILLTSINTGKSVKLNWSEYEGDDFISYKIFTEDFIPIAEITDINITEYDFTDFKSLVEDKEYQIIVESTGDYEHVIGSNIIKDHPGVFIDFPYYISKIINDPFREKAYALVGNKYQESDTYGILIINTEPDNYKIDTHILKENIYADLDISPDGNFLFLCQERGEKITKLDLNTLDATTFTTNTGDWGIHKIEVGNNNILYCHRDPPTSGSTAFWIYDGNNGNYLNGPTGISRHGDTEYNILNNKLYSCRSNTTDGQIYRHSTVANEIDIELTYPGFPESISSPQAFMLLTEDNKNIFWENFQFDKDLNLLRTFDTNIKACSPENVYLADFERIYDFEDMSIVYEFVGIPEGTGLRKSLIFPDDSTLIYSHSDQSNVRYSPDPYFRAQTYIFKFEID